MSPLLRHRVDVLPLFVCLGYPVAVIAAAFAFEGLGAWARVATLVGLGIVWQSGSYAYHHHNHLSFFRREHEWANRAFEVVCSAGWRIPVSREATYHFIHHAPGLLRSRERGYRGGLRAALDHCGFTSPRIFLANALDVFGLRWLVGVLLLGRRGYDIVPVVRSASDEGADRSGFSWHPLRGDFWGWVGTARRRGQLGQITAESVAIVVFQVALLLISPTFFAAYCVLHVVSYALYDLQDFCEHTRNDLRYDETVGELLRHAYNWWLFATTWSTTRGARTGRSSPGAARAAADWSTVSCRTHSRPLRRAPRSCAPIACASPRARGSRWRGTTARWRDPAAGAPRGRGPPALRALEGAGVHRPRSRAWR